MRILDPACGSGSFLLGAYQYLLDWHLHYYTTHDPGHWARQKTPRIYQTPTPDRRSPTPSYRLTTAERKRILLAHIYGVDIDPQAVEVTKLSLLLKVLEGENQQTLENQLRLFHERALPDLASNIKCGNSLIGPDFYENRQMDLFDEEERYRINAFDWHAEFPHIFAPSPPDPSRDRKGADQTPTAGFDAVIGNPPYVRVSNVDEAIRPYLYTRYEINHRFDIYVVFVQRGFDLLRESGILGFIVPNKFMTADYGASLREYLTSRMALHHILDFGDTQVFGSVTTYTCLLFASRSARESLDYQRARATPSGLSIESEQPIAIPTGRLGAGPWALVDEQAARFLEKLERYPPLGELCDIQHGLQTGIDQVFLVEAESAGAAPVGMFRSKFEPSPFPLESETVRRVTKGAVDIRRYYIEDNPRYVIFPYTATENRASLLDEETLRSKYPNTWAYLSRAKGLLGSKRKPGPWYSFRRRNYDLLDGIPRILVPSIAKHVSFALDGQGTIHFVGSGGGGGGGYGLNLKPGASVSLAYLLGILNSRLADWFVKLSNSRFGHGYYSFNRQYIEPIPICRPESRDGPARHDRMVELVDRMLTLHKQLSAAKTAHEKTVLQRQIDATDRQIDALVYELYDLTDEEIRIVEEATA